jgi:hypothetical protein
MVVSHIAKLCVDGAIENLSDLAQIQKYLTRNCQIKLEYPTAFKIL